MLLTSGIIANRADDVEHAVAAAGLVLLERMEEGDWVAFVHQKGSGIGSQESGERGEPYPPPIPDPEPPTPDSRPPTPDADG